MIMHTAFRDEMYDIFLLEGKKKPRSGQYSAPWNTI
ncbi:hypothetical protein P865_05925 [Brucella abortus 82]|nr:hypothetical protein M798_02250 [Brucella melitensis ADMAS-G1]ERM86950.1 hypothetical protein P865_05925 [Brucella abortus 82]EXU84878.1 hypothetical protein AX23_04940 [Brucella melitensis 548]